MVEKSLIWNRDTNPNPNPSREKQRRIWSDSPAGTPAEPCGGRWRTEVEQQIYSSRLVDALRTLFLRCSSVCSVRDAADRVLAVSARGRTRWSRALLTRRLDHRLSRIRRKHKRTARRNAGSRKPACQAKLPPMLRKVRALGRLVPGCRKLSLSSLLEETTDYIAALEMQVKAMAFITGVLNGSPVGVGGGASIE